QDSKKKAPGFLGAFFFGSIVVPSSARTGKRPMTDATQPNDEAFMREAMAEAAIAEAKGEVPVGSVVVIDGVIVGRGHNLRQTTQDPTAHAELLAVRDAAAAIGSWRLIGATVYVTLEPCPM